MEKYKKLTKQLHRLLLFNNIH